MSLRGTRGLSVRELVDGGTPAVRAIVWGAVVALACGAVAVLDPPIAQGALVTGVILVGVVVLAYAAAVMLSGVPLQVVARWTPEVPARLRRRRPPARDDMPGLTEMERMVIFGQASAYDFESRLRPHLVGIAEQRLAARGLSLRTPAQRLRGVLGDDLWNLVRPDYQRVGDREHAGVARATLQRAVERLHDL